jgi:hypothetical protein
MDSETKIERPLIIKIICIVGLLISLLEIMGSLYALHKIGRVENEWSIYLLIIPIINIVCWIGFWAMRKATIILFTINICFTIWVHYHIGVSVFDFYTILYIVIAIVLLGQLHKMDKFL